MELVGVRFTPSGRVHFFDPGQLALKMGDLVVVAGESGPREGRVVVAPGQVLFSEVRGPLRPVLRRVEPEDQDR